MVLMAVFVPCAFISGITGQFFKQFALTIAVSTFFSAAPTRSHSVRRLCALPLLKPKAEQTDRLTKLLNALTRLVLQAVQHRVQSRFVSVCQGSRLVDAAITDRACRVYGGLLFLTYKPFTTVPTGFIPTQDKGYLVVNVQLPDAASLELHCQRDRRD